MQQGDVLLFNTNEGGEIEVVGGVVTMSGGLETAVYISLFGGNVEDDGRPDNIQQYWGNLDETEPAKQLRSRTQHILDGLPATSANLLRLQDAATADLQWMLDESVASEVTVTASIPQLNRVAIVVTINAVGEEQTFTFSENWKAAV